MGNQEFLKKSPGKMVQSLLPIKLKKGDPTTKISHIISKALIWNSMMSQLGLLDV
jgi:hypothetical protein